MKQAATRREASAARIETPKNLSLRMDRLLAFIGHYQDMHRGETPTMDVMANEMNTTKETIRYWLGIMETEGRIRRFGFTPLRIMLKEGALPIERARKMDDCANGQSGGGWGRQIADLPEKRRERFEGAEARRFKLARFIGEHWAKHGEPPKLMAMMKAIGSTSGAVVTGMLSQLEQHGIIKRALATRPYEVALTESGMAALGIKKKEVEMENIEDKQLRPSTVVVVREAEPKKRAYKVSRRRMYGEEERRRMAARAIADHHAIFGTWPLAKPLSKKLGYASMSQLMRDLHTMNEAGLVSREGNKRYTPWRLTEKGRALLLDKADAPSVSSPEVAMEQRWPERGILAPTGPLSSNLGDRAEIAALKAEVQSLRQRLAEALTENAPPAAEPEKLTVADMVLALIEQGFDVKRRV